jgi:hypothetical protein
MLRKFALILCSVLERHVSTVALRVLQTLPAFQEQSPEIQEIREKYSEMSSTFQSGGGVVRLSIRVLKTSRHRQLMDSITSM